MPLCPIFLLTRSHIPVNQHQPNYQKLAAGLVGWHMASCKEEDFVKLHFLEFCRLYFNILSSIGLVH